MDSRPAVFGKTGSSRLCVAAIQSVTSECAPLLVSCAQDIERDAVHIGLYKINITRQQTPGAVQVVAELRQLDKIPVPNC